MASDDYIKVAGEVLALCAALDPYFPNGGDAVILAWAEALEHYELNALDTTDAVRKLYRDNPDPKFRPTIGLICKTARDGRQYRLDRRDTQIGDGKPKMTRAEFQRLHPEVKFPAIGKAVGDE